MSSQPAAGDGISHDGGGRAGASSSPPGAAALQAEATQLRAWIDVAQARLDWVTQELRRTGQPPSPAAGVTRGLDDAGASTPRAGGGTGVQLLLLALGGAVLGVAALVFVAVSWQRITPAGQLVSLIVVALGLSFSAWWLRHRLPATAQTLASVGVACLVLAVLAAPLLLGFDANARATLYPAAATGTVAGVAVLAGRRWSMPGWLWSGWLCVPFAAVLAVLPGIERGAVWAPWGLLVPGLCGVALLAGRPRGVWTEQDRSAAILAGLLAAVATAFGLFIASWFRTGALLGVLAVLAAALLAMWVLDGRTTWGLAGVGLGAVALGRAIGALEARTVAPALLSAVLVGALAAAALVLLCRRGRAGWGVLIAVPMVLAWLQILAIAPSWDAAPAIDVQAPGVYRSMTAVALLLLALGCFAGAVAGREQPGVSRVAWLGVGPGWMAVLLADPTGAAGKPLEWWTLPLAGLLLVAGVLWARGRPSVPVEPTKGGDTGRPPVAPGRHRFPRPTILVLGPAVSVALLPSALATWFAPGWLSGSGSTGPTASEHTARLLVVLAVAAVVVLVGARQRLAGLLVPGAAALTVALVGQLWWGLAALPRWLTLTVVGVALLAAGARLEHLRRRAQDARVWVGALR